MWSLSRKANYSIIQLKEFDQEVIVAVTNNAFIQVQALYLIVNFFV